MFLPIGLDLENAIVELLKILMFILLSFEGKVNEKPEHLETLNKKSHCVL